MDPSWTPWLMLAAFALGIFIDAFSRYRRTVIAIGCAGVAAVGVGVLFILAPRVAPHLPNTPQHMIPNNIVAILLFVLGVVMAAMMASFGVQLSRRIRNVAKST